MEPIFLIIILGFIVFAGWYFIWPRKQKETIEPEPKSKCTAPAIHYEPETPKNEFKYNLVGRVSKPISLNWTREKMGSHVDIPGPITKTICNDPNCKYEEHNYTIMMIKINKKIMDLQDQLLRHGKDGFELAPKDLIRYNAMIEVLKAMIN